MLVCECVHTYRCDNKSDTERERERRGLRDTIKMILKVASRAEKESSVPYVNVPHSVSFLLLR